MARPTRDRESAALALTFLLLATGFTLFLGFSLKQNCLDGSWQRPLFAFCDSDLLRLYERRGFDRDALPYVEEFNEYPPITAGIQYFAAKMTDTLEGWVHTQQWFLALCALATTVLLAQAARPTSRVFVWALGPPLALYAFHNWDAPVVLLTVASFYLFSRGYVGWGGAMMGLAFHAKIYPILFLPILGMELLRQEGGLGRRGWNYGLAAVGALVGGALPFLLWAREGYLKTFEFHADRGPTLESGWNALGHVAHDLGLGSLGDFLDGSDGLRLLSNALILAAVAVFAWAVWRGRIPWLQACLGTLAAFLLFNQVMSVQYALWVLPLLVLVAVPVGLVVAFFLTDAWVYYTVFDFWGHYPDDSFYGALQLASLARMGVYVALVAWTLRDVRKAPVQSARRRANPDRKAAPDAGAR